MTTFAVVPVCDDQLDLLAQVADTVTPLGSLRAEDFRTACEATAYPGGWVNPNDVSAYLHERFGEINPRSYSAKWAGACGPNGFLIKTDKPVGIDPAHSRGNGNKATFWRRLRVAA